MDAKEAIFEAMGWAEDASLTDVMKQGKSWLNKILKPKAPSELPKVPGTSGNPMGELEIHDKKVHPKGYHGGRCKYRAQMAEMGIDVASLDKQRGLPTPPNNDYTKGGEGSEEEEEVSDTPPQTEIFEQPQTAEVDGKEIKVQDQDQAAGAAVLNDILNTSKYTEEEKAVAREVAEALLKKLTPPVEPASAGAETAAQEPSAEQPAPEPTAPQEPPAETQEPPKEGAEGTVEEEQIEDIDFSEPEETPKEEAPAEVPEEKDPLAGIKEKKDWTPKQKKALERLAARFGEAVKGIKSSVGTEKFDSMLNQVAHFEDVQERWRTLQDPSDARKDVESALTEGMDKAVTKTFDELVADQIDKLLGIDVLVSETLSNSIKRTLEYTQEMITDPWATSEEIEKAHEHYRKLCDKYGLDELLESGESGRSGATVQGYLEDGDENHRTGGVVSSEGLGTSPLKIPTQKGNNIVPGEFTRQQEALDHISSVLSTVGMDAEVDVKKGVNTTQFSIALPDTATRGEAQKIIDNVLKKFPGLKTKETKKDGQKVIEPENVFAVFNPYTGNIDIKVHNDTKGEVPQSAIVNHPEFQKAIAEGKLVTSFATDENGVPIVIDLKKLPHMLFAGATGAGKNARLDAAVSSIMASKAPRDAQFMFIDGKGGGAEFGIFDNSPYAHLPTVGTDDAAQRTTYLINEMENRNKLIKKLGAKDIAAYNQKMQELVEKGEAPEGMPTHLPDMFLVVDEFGNIRDSLGHGKFDGLVKQIAEKGRSAGCHLFLATQKPTEKGGLSPTIKANIPVVAGVHAANGAESQNIIDERGLEELAIQGPVAIKTDTGVKYADGSFISGDDLSASLSSLPTTPRIEGTKKVSPEQTASQKIDEIAKTPGAKKGLTAIADKISKGDLRPFNVPEGEKADAVKQYLTAQGLQYTEKPAANGKITITPQKKEEPSAATETKSPAEMAETAAPAPVETPSPTTSTGEQANPYLDETELEGIDKITRNTLRSNASKINSLWSQYDSAKEGSEQQRNLGMQLQALIEEDNATRSETGGNLKLRNKEGALQPKESPETAESAGTGEETKPLSREDYEARYPNTREGQMRRIADARNAVLNAAWQKLAEAGVPEAQRDYEMAQDKRLQSYLKSLEDRKSDIEKQFPEGSQSKTSSAEQKEPITEAGKTIAPKDDVKGLNEEGKMRYDAALRRFNTAIASAREGLNSDTLDDDQYMEAVKNATDSLNKTRKALGFEKPVKSDGSFAEVVEEKAETAPEAKTTPVIPKTDAPENEPSAGEEIREEKETETEEIEVPSRTGRRGISKSKMESIKAEATKEPEAESTGAVSRADEEGSDLSASGKITAPKTPATSKATPTPSENDEVAESTSEESGSEKESPAPAKAELSPEMQTRLGKARERKSERLLKAKKTPPEEKAEPEPSKTPSAAATPEKKVEEPKKPASDTPKDALTKGMEGLDDKTRKAMQNDAGIQALQAKVVKAQAEKGKDSKEYKTATRMLKSAQKQFAEAYRQAQEENGGVVDVRTAPTKAPSNEKPKTESKEPVKEEKPSAEKVESPSPKKTEEKKEPSAPEPKKEEPKKQEPVKKESATPAKKEEATPAPKEEEEETPQARAYRERKEAEEKAKSEEESKKAAERAKRLEEARKQGGRTLNTQSSQYAEQARKDADTSKSKGFKTLTNLKKPEKVDNETANDLNRQFAEVAEEMQTLSDKLNTRTETSSLSPKETRQTVGLLEALRKGLEDVVDKTQLGKGNFNFKFLRDPDGKTIGLTITKYRGPDGKMQSVEEIKETEEEKGKQEPTQKKAETPSSKKSVPEQPTLFAGAEKARQEGEAKIAEIKRRWNERQSRKTPTKDEALPDGCYWSEEVFDGETEEEKVWQQVFDAALASME